MKLKIAISLLINSLFIDLTVAADDLSSIFSEGHVSGTIRAYYNTNQFETNPDQNAFSLGGNLHFETAPLYGMQAGVGFYSAHNLGINSDRKEKVISVLPAENIDILGEAYLRFTAFETAITGGRHKVDTPFANLSDAFIIPILFEGVSIYNQSIENLTLSANYLIGIKNRPSDEFVNVGEFSTQRLGVTSESTRGTTMANATYTIKSLKMQGWFYQFADLYNMGLFQADYAIPIDYAFKPFIGTQLILQKDEGDSLLGKVNTTGYGVQIGAAREDLKLTLAYNGATEEPGAFKNGAILAPYSFSTSSIFTNNQISTLENSDSGDAYKVTLNYQVTPDFKFMVSHAIFERNIRADTAETDFDFTYSFQKKLKGLSFRNRIAIITSNTDSAELLNIRTQLQYLF